MPSMRASAKLLAQRGFFPTELTSNFTELIKSTRDFRVTWLQTPRDILSAATPCIYYPTPTHAQLLSYPLRAPKPACCWGAMRAAGGLPRVLPPLHAGPATWKPFWPGADPNPAPHPLDECVASFPLHLRHSCPQLR